MLIPSARIVPMGRGSEQRELVELPEIERGTLELDYDAFGRQQEQRARRLIATVRGLTSPGTPGDGSWLLRREELSAAVGQVVRYLEDNALQSILGDEFRSMLDGLICHHERLLAGNIGSWIGNRLAQLSVLPPSPHLILLGGGVHARERIGDQLTLCGAFIPDETFHGQRSVSRYERYTDRSGLCITCAERSRQLPNSHPVNVAYWQKAITVDQFQEILSPVIGQALQPVPSGVAFDLYCKNLFDTLQASTLIYGAKVLLSLPVAERRRRLFSTAGMDGKEAQHVRRLQRAVRTCYMAEPEWPNLQDLSRLLERSLREMPHDESMRYNHAAAFIIGGAVYPKALQALLSKRPYGYDLGFVRGYYNDEILPTL